MGEEKSNPQAFPSMAPPESWGDPSTGMTLRDWFAGQALAAMDLFDDGAFSQGAMERDALWAASAAYRYADAMLAERSKP